MRHLRFVPAIVLAGLLAAATQVGAEVPRRPSTAKGPPRAMVALPGGTWRPLYGRAGDTPVRVAGFRLDRDPVTRGDFLAFVRADAAWRKSRADARVAAPDGYLADWRGDLEAGEAADLRRPVTGVSWFAARAYCAAHGKRLPTVAEWEYAAAASETARDAARDPRFVQRLVSVYASRQRVPADVAAGTVNAYGVRGLHDFGWEWTADFDGGRATRATPRHGHDHAAHAAHAAHDAAAHAADPSCAGAAIGALDPTNYPAFLRHAIRSGLAPQSTLSTLGFRCAR